ncbi:TRAP transporter large permease [Sulfitobacter mediterraneus]|jgi:C4-dicarboxylate transporter DctM subunit|uniref:TRAP transporter large permease n=4 Tax=Sulfitobacter mediterraneus TaxID=83219 RepID=UPI0019343217|nr:TRAP transporter large permease [Sulfitobacter mediterraneus]MBM1311979.1 TRAP transporter large permease [Sulfitobacter mediterraneus]MBM1315884.1 TRAP transporter large permease [Sulfitobacter mediterraneus]MBM1324222.1 TRAP transporter large permease [Sulfitobacter mediterraneus]MBM1328127.1 TRAP transporter large permease [Sulfitobacter mediterraneus]MBM1399524.1 TRAP transporter large permease [Sulfitobacter mediterraneus]
MLWIGLIVLIFGALALRVNIAAILLVVGAYIHFFWGDAELTYILEDMWSAIDKEVLLSIPLFLLCGSVMGKGAIAERLINVMRALTAPVPGGMALATILTCAVFAAISGSSAVTLIAVGTIAYPALINDGYSKSFALGALATGGTLGVVIPPSIPMILYGIVTETSIVDLFTAGILPGLFLTTLLGIYTVIANRHVRREAFSLTHLISTLQQGVWSLLMPVILLGGIYSGHFSPTESAAVALAYALIVERFVHRELTLRDLYDTAIDTTTMMGALFPLLAIALSINLLLTTQQVPGALTEWVSSYVSDKTTFLLIINVLLLLVGCIMDMASAILVLAPILLQMGEAFGIDPVHLGVIMTVNLEIGLLTPPVGLNLIIAMTAFREPFGLIIRGVIPFILIMLFGLLVIAFVPQLSLMLVG